MKTIEVVEVKRQGRAWELTNKEMRALEIYKGLKTELDMVSVRTENTQMYGTEMNRNMFKRKFYIQMIEELLEIVKIKKANAWNNFYSRMIMLTGAYEPNNIIVEEFDNGFYLIQEATRNVMKTFINLNGNVIRKPKNNKLIEEIVY